MRGRVVDMRWSPSWTKTSAKSNRQRSQERGRGLSRPCTTRSCESASGPSRADCRDLISGAGRTVEIGSGTGLNLPHYPDDLDELVLTEPDAAMRSRLAKGHTPKRPTGATGRRAGAATCRSPTGSVDTVVSTFVLCTAEAPDLALREIAGVLRPDGQLLFIEHVRSESPRLARWQDRLARPWYRFARGCRCNRAIAELIATCGFELDDVRDASWRGMPPIVRPLIVGRAHKARTMTETVSRVADEAWAASASGSGRFTDG